MSFSNSDVISADKQSIFGDTYSGVVSPLVPHVHPYPTRFHGPIYNYPRFYRPYRTQSFMVPGNYLNPNLSVSGLGDSDSGATRQMLIGFGLLAASAIFLYFKSKEAKKATPNLRANRNAKKNSDAPNLKRQPRCPVGTEVQTLVFDRAYFTPDTAKKWANKHGFKSKKVDQKPNALRIRQHDPANFMPELFRTIYFRPGVKAVVGCPR